jgi:hypothetical protein
LLFTFGAREVADDDQRIAIGLERLEDRRELERGTRCGGRPLAHDHAMRDVDEAHAELRFRRGLRHCRERRHHRIEQWKRHAHTNASEERASRDRPFQGEHVRAHDSSRARLI